jgi:hypothetical protein
VELLKSEAEKVKLQIEEAELKVTEEEDNPFYSVVESGQSYGQLVGCWMAAEKYWLENIAHQFDIREF